MNHNIHWTPGQAPVADAYNTDPATDIVRVEGEGIIFLVHEGVGATGTVTLTVEASDDVSASNTTAIPFIVRAQTTADTWSAWASSSSYATTAGSNHIYEIYVDSAEVQEEGYGYVRLQMTELVDSPVLAGVMIGVVNPRYSTPGTLLT